MTFLNNRGHFPLSASLGIFLFVFYGKLTLKFLWDPWKRCDLMKSKDVAQLQVFGSFGWLTSAMGHGNLPLNRGLVSVEGGSSTSILGQDHLQRATQLHPGAIPLANANYGRNPFRWLVGKGCSGCVAFRSVCWSNLRDRKQRHMSRKKM